MKVLKKCMVLVLSVLLVFSLVACVGANESVLGKYNSTRDDMPGFIDLKSGEKLSVDLLGIKGEGTWKLEGEDLTLVIEDDPLVVQLKDNKIIMNLAGNLVLYFVR